MYPPDPSSLDKSLVKLRRVASDCGARLCLCDGAVSALRLSSRLNLLNRQAWLMLSGVAVAAATAAAAEPSFDEPALREEDIAFIQYTSGSTAEPKGVMISFANLYHQLTLDYHRRGVAPDGPPLGRRRGLVGVSWLPQYHDMGLIVATLAPFCGGYRMHYASPMAFVRRPPLWVQLMSRVKAHWSVAPDFAFKLTARKFLAVQQQQQRVDEPALDLSNIYFVSSGGEPLRADSVKAFADAFRPHGLRERW
ncbi:unnamed protein product [Phaeothamnion confervicola]